MKKLLICTSLTVVLLCDSLASAQTTGAVNASSINDSGYLNQSSGSNSQSICNVLAEDYYGTAGCPTYAHTYLNATSVDQGLDQSLEVDLYNNVGATNGHQSTDFSPVVVAGPQAGSTWNQANEIVLKQGYGASGTPSNAFLGAGIEQDFINGSGFDWAPSSGRGNLFGFWLQGQGNNPSTAGLYITGQTSNYNTDVNDFGWHYGILIQGDYAAKDVDVNLSTNATTSIADYGNLSSILHDYSKSVNTIIIDGTQSGASILAESSAPSAFASTGVKSQEEFYAGASSPEALNIVGTKSYADMNTSASSPDVLFDSGLHNVGIDFTSDSKMTNSLDMAPGQHVCYYVANVCNYTASAPESYTGLIRQATLSCRLM